MSFEVIDTEEKYNEAVKGTVEAAVLEERKKYEGYLSPEDVDKKYKGYMSPESVQEKYKDYISPEDAAKKDALIKGYELERRQVKAAREAGIPIELAKKLSGDTDEDMKKDAENMAKFIKAKNAPDYVPEGKHKEGAGREAVRRMLDKLKEE